MLKHTPKPSKWHWLTPWVGVAFCLILITSCTPSLQFLSINQGEIGMTMQVSASQTPGIYEIEGQTNLPDNTPLTVLALRYLSLPEATVTARDTEPAITYAVLDYQSTTLSKGRWKTELNLWQSVPKGQNGENWQWEEERLEVGLKPMDEVVFLATLTPLDQLSYLEQQLAQRQLKFAPGITRQTADGQRYAEVSETLVITPPTIDGKEFPPALEDENYGWGDRYIIPQEPQNPTQLEFPEQRQTNAPFMPGEFLR